MSRYLVTHDGLYLGSSSACNLVASVKLAKRLGQGCRIATILWVSLGIVPVMLGHREADWSGATLATGIRASFGPTTICRLTTYLYDQN